jgi:hypothetical protein
MALTGSINDNAHHHKKRALKPHPEAPPSIFARLGQLTGFVFGILGLAVFGISLTRLADGKTVYLTTYREVAVYVPISAALGIGIALAMFLRWRKGR